MDLNFSAIPDAPESLIWFNILMVILTIAALVATFICLFGAEDDRIAARTNGLEIETPKRDRAGIITLVLTFAFALAAVIGIMNAINLGNSRDDAVRGLVVQQAQERYGLELNKGQAGDLINRYLVGYDSIQLGTTTILLDDQIVEVTLYHVGDKWLLSRTEGGKSIVELPTVN